MKDGNSLDLTQAPPGMAEYREGLRSAPAGEVWSAAVRGIESAVEAAHLPDVDEWKLRCELDELARRIATPGGNGLPEFDPDAGCPKCAQGTGQGDAESRFCPGGAAKGICAGRDGEHIHRRCNRCRYEWLERCVRDARAAD